jgi:hypothetical protein
MTAAAMHPEGETPRDIARRERTELAALRAARAVRAIEDIRAGGNPGDVSMALANEFTDETTAAIKKRLTRGF